MKQIGQKHVDGAVWSSTFIKNPYAVTIFTAEDAENVSSDHYEHIGWILPGDATGGKIYDTRGQAGTHGVAAYVRRVPTDPMNVTRSEFDTIVKQTNAVIKLVKEQQERIAKLERHWGITADDRGPEMIGMPRRPQSDSMTFYDHAFIHAFNSICNSNESDGLKPETILKLAHQAAAHLTAARHPAKTE